MARRLPKNPADYIQPLNINGMDGRMLYLPGPKGETTELLFIYGHHSSLERWWGLTQVLGRYANVTMPDLPGFGGMDSFYKIGKQPTLDNLADYLAAFVKLRYNKKKFVIVGMSFGFAIATRMLQRYPEMTKQVEMVCSIAGFAHKDDFVFTRRRHFFYLTASKIFSRRLPAIFFRYVALSPFILRFAYKRTRNAKSKFAGASAEELEEITKVEIGLWHSNEVRSYMKTTTELLTIDNCKARINLPVYHVGIAADQYFDGYLVEQHLRTIYTDFTLLTTLNVGAHAPSIIADEKAAAPYIPLKLRKLVAKL
jgi:pimeloyl-ACP methyl ester carboxylesterase